MKNNIINYFVIAAIILSFGSCKAQKKATDQKNKNRKEFTLPEIPAVLTDQRDRANFLAKNYWQNFEFSDTTLIRIPQISEQAFVNYIFHVLQHSDPNAARDGITAMISKAMDADSAMFAYFVDLSEKYFHDPNAPTRNEEFFIPVLKYIISSPKVSEIDKIRPQHLLDIAMKNRVGDKAIDFVYTTANGHSGRLYDIRSDYTIIFINNPGCHDCQRVKKVMSSSATINRLLYNKSADKPSLTILAIYPDEDLTEWKEETYSDKWINGYDAGQKIRKGGLYDLKAIPSLYLLDKNKTVILKDETIEAIEQWLFDNIK